MEDNFTTLNISKNLTNLDILISESCRLVRNNFRSRCNFYFKFPTDMLQLFYFYFSYLATVVFMGIHSPSQNFLAASFRA